MNFLDSTLGLVIAGGAFLLFLLVLLLAWRALSVKSITRQDTSIPSTGLNANLEAPAVPPPTFDDLALHGSDAQGGFSSQLQTARHNLRIEQVDNRMIYTVDGVTYQQLEDIPEEDDLRKTTRRLQDKTFSAVHANLNEELRQVQIGNQTTLEARSPDYTISIQSEGGSPRFIVNGLTYYQIGDIPEPDLQRRARELLGKIV